MKTTLAVILGGPDQTSLIRALDGLSLDTTVEFQLDQAPAGSVAASRGNRILCVLHLVARDHKDLKKFFLVGATESWETQEAENPPTFSTTFRAEYDVVEKTGRIYVGISGGFSGQRDNYYEIFSALHIH